MRWRRVPGVKGGGGFVLLTIIVGLCNGFSSTSGKLNWLQILINHFITTVLVGAVQQCHELILGHCFSDYYYLHSGTISSLTQWSPSHWYQKLGLVAQVAAITYCNAAFRMCQERGRSLWERSDVLSSHPPVMVLQPTTTGQLPGWTLRWCTPKGLWRRQRKEIWSIHEIVSNKHCYSYIL